jgi:hypothetical protein
VWTVYTGKIIDKKQKTGNYQMELITKNDCLPDGKGKYRDFKRNKE